MMHYCTFVFDDGTKLETNGRPFDQLDIGDFIMLDVHKYRVTGYTMDHQYIELTLVKADGVNYAMVSETINITLFDTVYDVMSIGYDNTGEIIEFEIVARY